MITFFEEAKVLPRTTQIMWNPFGDIGLLSLIFTGTHLLVHLYTRGKNINLIGYGISFLG